MTAFAKLHSTRCVCGNAKRRGLSFCWECWKELPRAIQVRLYKDQGYAEAVNDAEKVLREKGRIGIQA